MRASYVVVVLGLAVCCLAAVRPDFFGLTPRSAEVTTPDGFRVLKVDPAKDPPRIGTKSDGDVDEGVVGRLRDWRLERARMDAVPAYVVLHDATLRELAAVRPRTLDELASVKGFGPVKVERYGDALLAVLAS
jgi:superfamily II DNA helicase RecQ